MHFCVARWRLLGVLDLTITRSRVQIPTAALSCPTLDIIYTLMCLCHQAY